MEITGYIKQVFDARGGISARSGNSWKTQSFLLETIEQHPRRMVFEVFGEDKLQQMDIHAGEEMTVSFDVDAHEYQGKWYNQIRAWKVEKSGKQILQPQTTPQPQQQAQPVQPSVYSQQAAQASPLNRLNNAFNTQEQDEIPF